MKKRRIKANKSSEPTFPYNLRRRKHKSDWAGITLADAFKPNLDYYQRLRAQRLFYKTTRKIQIAVARLASYSQELAANPKVKPQLGPCYTTYPSRLSTFASIGLTAYLEFQARTHQKLLPTAFAEYHQQASTINGLYIDPEIYRKMFEKISRIVETRLYLEDLSRSPCMAFVELYRLFSASQQQMKFRSVPELLNTVILYGDILPDWNEQKLHPLTGLLLKTISDVCYPFFELLPNTDSLQLVALGSDWVRELIRALERFLPPLKQTTKGATTSGKLQQTSGPREFRFDDDAVEKHEPNLIPPLEGPHLPSLFDPETSADRILDRSKEPESPQGTQKVLEQFQDALRWAGEQSNQWEDMRSDQVELILRETPFKAGPLEGCNADGHKVEIAIGEQKAGGEIFDRPLALSDDFQAAEILIQDSQPVSEALRRVLYPNVVHVPQTEQLRTNGLIDPSRLSLLSVSQAVFQRYRIQEDSDRRGRPVLLIACDGSGSLEQAQMKMAKILVTAWLTSTTKTQVQVLAGLYHSGDIRYGLTGPLVQWMYHPLKTPATNRKEAICAVASLPAAGTGVQSDALSIVFMLREARRIARHRMIYLIWITDCQWNCSFYAGGRTGFDEVCSVMEEAYDGSKGKLHTTLVALGVKSKTGLESLLDKVITISNDELADPTAVANQIGVYVGSCIKERKKT